MRAVHVFTISLIAVCFLTAHAQQLQQNWGQGEIEMPLYVRVPHRDDVKNRKYFFTLLSGIILAAGVAGTWPDPANVFKHSTSGMEMMTPGGGPNPS